MTGGALVKLLQSEGLPSSLQLLLSAMKNLLEPGHMTAEDVGQWANEQLRDIRRLQRHLEDVRGTVDPLRDRLAAAEAELQRLTSELEMTRTDSKRQMEKQQATVVRLEFSLNKAERSLKAAEQSLREKKRELERETSSLEQRNSRLQEKVAAQQETQQVLESEKIALEEKLKSENEACRLLRQTVQELQAQISESRILLDKENTKFDSARRQQESMQTKQKSLLEQVEALDEECEELQRQLEERRDTQVQLEEELQRTTDEKERLQVQLNKQQDCGSELQKEKQMLEANVRQLDKDVAELREHVLTLTQRERLLVAFPELSPLARTQPQSTGNMLLDMEKQMQANDIRIKVLEEENAALRCSLGKVRALGQRGALREPSSPSLSDGPAESPRTDHGLGQKNQLYSSSSSISNVGHERSDSGVMSVGSEGRRGSSTGSPSQPVHLQTLQLKTPQHAATRCRTHGVSVHSHGRGLRQRK
ncbi:coiled-coil domain-containing protein 157 [Cynoglossus semilaevis]|nr:coiled-coil domain-containing protein 157 [Cynoglossus semilaevis]